MNAPRIAPVLSAVLFATVAVTTACATDEDSIDLADFEYIEMPANMDIEPTGQPCAVMDAAAPCLDEESVAFCAYDFEDYSLEFNACQPVESLACVPGDIKTVDSACGEREVTCRVFNGTPDWSAPACDDGWGEENTPLVLRFDDAPITMIAAEQTPAATFDINMAADGQSCIHTDWPSAATPWLALDLDHSGTIDGGHELFGSGTELAGGDKARNGFIALAAYDSNRDGQIDAQDPVYAELLLWRDHDADRLSSPGELEPLAEAGVTSLAVNYVEDRQCDARGNCGIERAGFRHAGGHGELVDVHLACQ